MTPVGYWCHLPLVCVSEVIMNDYLSVNLVICMKKCVPDVTTTTPNWRQMPQRAHPRSTTYLISTATGVLYSWSVWPKSLGMTTCVWMWWYFWKKCARRDYNDCKLMSNAPARPSPIWHSQSATITRDQQDQNAQMLATKNHRSSAAVRKNSREHLTELHLNYLDFY